MPAPPWGGTAWAGEFTPWRHAVAGALAAVRLAQRDHADAEGMPRHGATGAWRRTAKMARVEAVLLVANTALSARKIAQCASLADATEARTVVGKLNRVLEHEGAPFRVERVATGYRLLTLPQYALWLGKLHHRQAELSLSAPVLETLTVVSYRQPVTRAEIEAVRGVQCAEILKQLLERGLVKIASADESLGRPYLYATTPEFLELFGLASLDELPLADSLRRKPAANDAAHGANEAAPAGQGSAAA